MDTDYSGGPDDAAIIFAVIVAVMFSIIYICVRLEMRRRRKEAERRKWEADAEIPFCPQCRHKLDVGAHFCSYCQNGNLTNWAQQKKDNPFAPVEMVLAPVAAAFRPISKAAKEHKENEKLLTAREFYDGLVQCSYCKECQKEQPPGAQYCDICGESTVPFTREMVFKWLRSGRPDVVATEEDFQRLEKMGTPILGWKARIAFDVTKFVAKKTGQAALGLAKRAAKKSLASHSRPHYGEPTAASSRIWVRSAKASGLSASDQNAAYFLAYAGDERGPFTLQQVLEACEQQEMRESALYWKDGLQEWRSVSELL
jgi:hypothetical protein